jgi:hypothetical protein
MTFLATWIYRWNRGGYMTSRFVRVALLSSFVLVTPLLTFAGGQPAKMRWVSKEEAQDRTGITRSLNQGKGAGMTLSSKVIRANAYREQTAADQPATTAQTVAAHPKAGDPAFTK